MDLFFYLSVLFVLAYWCFRQGKHVGSIKGFNVGRRRRRH